MPGRYGWKGVLGPTGDTGATGATGIQIQDIRRRRRQAEGCPGIFQYTNSQSTSQHSSFRSKQSNTNPVLMFRMLEAVMGN